MRHTKEAQRRSDAHRAEIEAAQQAAAAAVAPLLPATLGKLLGDLAHHPRHSIESAVTDCPVVSYHVGHEVYGKR